MCKNCSYIFDSSKINSACSIATSSFLLFYHYLNILESIFLDNWPYYHDLEYPMSYSKLQKVKNQPIKNQKQNLLRVPGSWVPRGCKRRVAGCIPPSRSGCSGIRSLLRRSNDPATSRPSSCPTRRRTRTAKLKNKQVHQNRIVQLDFPKISD